MQHIHREVRCRVARQESRNESRQNIIRQGATIRAIKSRGHRQCNRRDVRAMTMSNTCPGHLGGRGSVEHSEARDV
jgi:hypothetical protein